MVSIDLCKSNSALLHLLVPCLPAQICGCSATRNPLHSSLPHKTQCMSHVGSILTSMCNGSEFKRQGFTARTKDDDYGRGYWNYNKNFDYRYLPFSHSL